MQVQKAQELKPSSRRRARWPPRRAGCATRGRLQKRDPHPGLKGRPHQNLAGDSPGRTILEKHRLDSEQKGGSWGASFSTLCPCSAHSWQTAGAHCMPGPAPGSPAQRTQTGCGRDPP